MGCGRRLQIVFKLLKKKSKTKSQKWIKLSLYLPDLVTLQYLSFSYRPDLLEKQYITHSKSHMIVLYKTFQIRLENQQMDV